MAVPIEDYALLSDCQGAALVNRSGSIDWLCLPRFDSDPCMCALLGESRHGRWLIAPMGGCRCSSRGYVDGTLVLESRFETPTGVVDLVEFMPQRTTQADIVRIVTCRSGHVDMRLELVVRLDFGEFEPWNDVEGTTCTLVGGPDLFHLSGPVPLCVEQGRIHSHFTMRAGDVSSFVLLWMPSHMARPAQREPAVLLQETLHWWKQWSEKSSFPHGPLRTVAERSLIALKALTYEPTGGIVAAATTSLPERIGGTRNWDYRYCWLRDATFTLHALMSAGYRAEAEAWYDWLLRAVASEPGRMQIVYGVAGERRLPEREIPFLPGYENSRPVRTGNAAYCQRQWDVYGEVMDSLHFARGVGIKPGKREWDVQSGLIEHVERAWDEPDHGIWESRLGDAHNTYSKIMAWVAVDRAIKAVEVYSLDGPVNRWKALRARIHEQVCNEHFDDRRGCFTRIRGDGGLDASLLRIPLVGFLPSNDPRVKGTVEAIERELVQGDFVWRYLAGPETDGLPGTEGAFLLCSFWLADTYLLQGRVAEARRIFQTMLSIRNDVGFLSEEYDPVARRLVGNFPQAFSHVALVNTAMVFARGTGEESLRSQ